jgi:exopolysaccharide biosynthesis polyprenyl glycosylphosphotransferase
MVLRNPVRSSASQQIPYGRTFRSYDRRAHQPFHLGYRRETPGLSQNLSVAAGNSLTPRGLAECLFLLDTAAAVLALFAANWLYTLNLVPIGRSVHVDLEPSFVALTLAVWTIAFWWSGAYPMKHWRGVFGEWQAVGHAFALGALICAGFLYVTFRDTPRPLFLYFVALDLPCLLATRALVQLIDRLGLLRLPISRVAIIGTGRQARDAAEMIAKRHKRGIQLVGFIGEKSETGMNVIGRIDDVAELVRRHQVTHVIVSSRAALARTNVLPQLVRTPVTIMVKPDSIDLGFARTGFEEFGGMPLLNVRPSGLRNWHRPIKRFQDVLLALGGLLVLSPVIGLIALAIRLESEGPVIFRQQRVGEGGRVFTILKFRTMRAERRKNDSGPPEHLTERRRQYKSRNDPRITRVGRFLRTWSLDEIPQLWNILTGEMSVVGPRPELPDIVSRYVDWQFQRFCTPPGLTGWWQVNGRSDRPMHEHVEDDIYYIQHSSPWLDLVILGKTVPAVLTRRGAY